MHPGYPLFNIATVGEKYDPRPYALNRMAHATAHIQCTGFNGVLSKGCDFTLDERAAERGTTAWRYDGNRRYRTAAQLHRHPTFISPRAGAIRAAAPIAPVPATPAAMYDPSARDDTNPFWSGASPAPMPAATALAADYASAPGSPDLLAADSPCNYNDLAAAWSATVSSEGCTSDSSSAPVMLRNAIAASFSAAS